MVTRKTASEKKKEKPVVEGPPPRRFDTKRSFSTLEDAVKDGKFVGQVGCELVVEKIRDGKRHRSICEVREVNGDQIDTFDHTLGQWYTFSCAGLEKYGVVVKLNDEKKSS